jgi:cytochrome c-type biogenesis protein CcmE
MAETSTILKDAAVTNQANKKIKFIIGGLVIVGLIGYLIASSISSAGAYYREVGEVLEQQTALTGKNLRVSGNVVTESITYDAATLNLNFNISDPADPAKQIPIHFHGVQPDQMTREGSSAIVEGSLGPNGVVEANNLLLKCPSRYEEYEEIEVQAVK